MPTLVGTLQVNRHVRLSVSSPPDTSADSPIGRCVSDLRAMSIGVRQCPSLEPGAVTQLVTRSADLGGRDQLLRRTLHFWCNLRVRRSSDVPDAREWP